MFDHVRTPPHSFPAPKGSFSWSHKRNKSLSLNLLGWIDLSYWTLTRCLFTSRATKASQRYSSSCSRLTKCSSNGEVSGKSSTARFKEGISHSTGNTDSTPCTSWYGEQLVAVLTIVLYTHKARYNIMCQLFLLCAMFHWGMDLSDFFTASTCPFAWG